MHPTLFVGPYDWDAERLPQSEFEERIQAFWRQIDDAEIFGAIVYGDSRNHAELGYLSHFTPKLGPAFLLLPRRGEPTLLASGAPNMIAAAKRLTWIARVEPLRDICESVTEWWKELGTAASPQRAVLIGGDYMSSAYYHRLGEALGKENAIPDATASVQALMQAKRPREIAIIREGCGILNVALDALARTKQSGAGLTAMILEAEQKAYRLGAQDVRTLFSLDDGQTLRPFETPVDDRRDSMQVYIALRHAGNWTEGFVCLAQKEHPALLRAIETLRGLVRIAEAGTAIGDLAGKARSLVQPLSLHEVVGAKPVSSMGLSMNDSPGCIASKETKLIDGGVYSLRAGASDDHGYHAIVSAMIVARQGGNELLWSAV